MASGSREIYSSLFIEIFFCLLTLFSGKMIDVASVIRMCNLLAFS